MFPPQDQGQDSLLVKRRNDNHSPGPVIRELVPSSHQRRELSNTILCIFSRWDQRIGEGIPIPDSLGGRSYLYKHLYYQWESEMPPWPGMPFCQQVCFTHLHNISKWHPGSREGTGSAKQKWFVVLKSSFTLYEKEDFRFSLKHQLYKCMYSWL